VETVEAPVCGNSGSTCVWKQWKHLCVETVEASRLVDRPTGSIIAVAS
jgi:hypothetical protein